MKAIIKKIKNAAALVKKENKEFSYIASSREIAGNIWHSHLNSSERFEILQETGGVVGKKEKEILRNCYSFVELHI